MRMRNIATAVLAASAFVLSALSVAAAGVPPSTVAATALCPECHRL